jgi:hypothetical protein
MSSARIRFTAAEREACEDFEIRVERLIQLGTRSMVIQMDEALRMATIARLVLMLTDAPARARLKAKAKPRKRAKRE